MSRIVSDWLTDDHWSKAWLLVPISRLEVRRHSQWTCGSRQGASGRMGSNRSLLWLCRVQRWVRWLQDWHSWWLWLQSLDFLRPWGENQEAFGRAGQWPTGHDGNHRHVLSGGQHGEVIDLCHTNVVCQCQSNICPHMPLWICSMSFKQTEEIICSPWICSDDC